VTTLASSLERGFLRRILRTWCSCVVGVAWEAGGWEGGDLQPGGDLFANVEKVDSIYPV